MAGNSYCTQGGGLSGYNKASVFFLTHLPEGICVKISTNWTVPCLSSPPMLVQETASGGLIKPL